MRRVLTNVMVALLLATPLAEGQRPSHSGPSTSQVRPSKRRKATPKKAYQIGKASWYGPRFHGRATASGEPFNMFELTAAHRRLPLGTLVRVTNLSNGKWVIVRINDRGPVPESRIIDLSYVAGQLLGVGQKGILRVRLDLVDTPPLTLALARATLRNTP
jgi:rare lipoprotein A